MNVMMATCGFIDFSLVNSLKFGNGFKIRLGLLKLKIRKQNCICIRLITIIFYVFQSVKIVWDDKLKRYVNKDGSSDPIANIKPPPTFLPNAPTPLVQQSTLNNAQAPSTSGQPNQFPQQQQQQQQPLPMPGNPAQNRFSLKSQSKYNLFFI